MMNKNQIENNKVGILQGRWRFIMEQLISSVETKLMWWLIAGFIFAIGFLIVGFEKIFKIRNKTMICIGWGFITVALLIVIGVGMSASKMIY